MIRFRWTDYLGTAVLRATQSLLLFLALPERSELRRIARGLAEAAMDQLAPM